MATTNQREAIKTADQSWTAEAKSKLLMEFDENANKIRDLQLEIAGKGYVLDSNSPVYYGRSTENVLNTAGVPENKKLALANESGMAQEDLILIFCHELKSKCELEVQIREPKTIEEAYKITIKIEKFENYKRIKVLGQYLFINKLNIVVNNHRKKKR
ncbi:hypothetical protein BpHYR1_036826 [Brachionus plicatilis]|uniref:Uncharacterized protein n=1 Tax=Brachionus plicatilis TaxID=10195 RepID=A0A3M7RHF0_BRAPC|nr:hypothetical protein BpHYR1_036826 [Brachionus plicatilis]